VVGAWLLVGVVEMKPEGVAPRTTVLAMPFRLAMVRMTPDSAVPDFVNRRRAAPLAFRLGEGSDPGFVWSSTFFVP
jgi:hypothetical protein